MSTINTAIICVLEKSADKKKAFYLDAIILFDI